MTLAPQRANFATPPDPERMVIGGGLMNASKRVRPPSRHQLMPIVSFPPDRAPGAFVAGAALLGAATVVADAVSSDQPVATKAPRASGHRVSALPTNSPYLTPVGKPGRSVE